MPAVKQERSKKEPKAKEETKPYFKAEKNGDDKAAQMKKRNWTLWSAEEEAIWSELVEKGLRTLVLPMIRQDPRLKHRCLGSHMGTTISRMKRSGFLQKQRR